MSEFLSAETNIDTTETVQTTETEVPYVPILTPTYPKDQQGNIGPKWLYYMGTGSGVEGEE